MLFRHKSSPDAKEAAEPKEAPAAPAPETPKKEVNLSQVSELLEKNLKWSQIIYEQNRRLNNKLLWSAVASWLRFLMLAVPLILALWLLPPLYRELKDKYTQLLGGAGKVESFSPSSLNQLMKLLPLDAAAQEQLKAILK